MINYKNESVGDRIRQITRGVGVDRVLEVDLAANARLYTSCLRRDGQVIVYGSADWNTQLPLRDWLIHSVTTSFFIVYELSQSVRERAIADLTGWLEQDRLVHRVAARYSLDETALAHEAVESGQVIGNVVVVP